jgi:hypothetical protein
LAATCPAMGRRESLGEFSRDRPPNSLAGLERILGPILADWRPLEPGSQPPWPVPS